MNQDEIGRVTAEYRSRLDDRESSFRKLDRKHRMFGNTKVALFLLTAVLAWVALREELFSAAWTALPIAAFVWIAVVHERVIVRRKTALRAVSYYKDGLDRLDGRWAGRGSAGSRFRSSEHPYSEDLDLFGPGSLFELMCAARTRVGEERLAQWLCAPCEIQALKDRQAAVEELTDHLDIREDIAMLGAETAESANLQRLGKWAREPVIAPSAAVNITAILLTIITVVAGIFAASGQTKVPLEFSIIIGQGFAFYRRTANAAAARDIDNTVKDLEILADVLKRLEQETFHSKTLTDIASDLSCEGEPPSKRIAHLVHIVAWRDALRNNLFVLLGIPLLWSTHTALALERWRRRNGVLVPMWIESVGMFEAICSIARFAYEQPDAVVPTLVESEGVFEATAVRHPLLPRGSAVSNSISIGPTARLYIVSGSNMSGKSTLLRTIGINVVLALAGAPVCADNMRVGPLHIGASLRTNDSLQAGVSRFYAEITRLRQVVDIARDTPPALFLLDEILHGTNSHDRTVGAEAVLRALLTAQAIGLVTTHDLALAKIADDIVLCAVNVHFQDDMVDGKMSFDYTLRPGVVQKSNAIPLMRAVGLDV